MKELVLLVGPPGSGKTTYYKEFLTDHRYVNQDSQGKVGHFQSFLKLIANDHSKIVVDRCNFSKKQRKRYIDPAKYLGYKVKIIVMPILHEAEYFNRARQRADHPTIKKDLTDEKIKNIINFFVQNLELPKDTEADKIVWL